MIDYRRATEKASALVGCQIAVFPFQETRMLKYLAVSMIAAWPSSAAATETYCGVSERTPDGYVVLRQGPGPSFPPEGSIFPSDFLYLDTAPCRADFGPQRCSPDKSWVFVEKVVRQSGSAKKGWANAKLIRQIACPSE